MKKVFFFITVICSIAMSQDFGYEYMMLTEYRSIGANYNLHSFKPAASNGLTDSNRISFTSALPMIEFRQSDVRLAIGYQTFNDINKKKKESFSVYGESHNDIALDGSKKSKANFYIPIVVSANYVRAQSTNAALANFDIGSFGLGTGVKFKHYERSFGIQVFAVGSLYYASEGFSTGYGTQTSLCGEIQLVFPQLFYQGLLVGYRIESQQWNMSNNELDYNRLYHGAFIGFLF